MAPKANTVIAGGTAVGLLFLTYQADLLPNLFRTQGTSNIEKRFSSGGGTATHTPGVATPTGDPDNVTARSDKQQGIGTEKFKEKFADQRPDGSAFDKAWNKSNYGAEKGK